MPARKKPAQRTLVLVILACRAAAKRTLVLVLNQRHVPGDETKFSRAATKTLYAHPGDAVVRASVLESPPAHHP